MSRFTIDKGLFADLRRYTSASPTLSDDSSANDSAELAVPAFTAVKDDDSPCDFDTTFTDSNSKESASQESSCVPQDYPERPMSSLLPSHLAMT